MDKLKTYPTSRGQGCCFYQASVLIVDLVWPWSFTPFPPKSIISWRCPCTTCANLRFVYFQNIAFTTLVTDERTDERKNDRIICCQLMTSTRRHTTHVTCRRRQIDVKQTALHRLVNGDMHWLTHSVTTSIAGLIDSTMTDIRMKHCASAWQCCLAEA